MQRLTWPATQVDGGTSNGRCRQFPAAKCRKLAALLIDDVGQQAHLTDSSWPGEPILQQLHSVFCQDGFWMKLHPLDVQFTVADAHDLTGFCPRSDLQASGDRIRIDHERVIPRRNHGPGKVVEYTLAFMKNFAG